jgi:pimeloyl-ACP methyl ester carboxylesterase
MRAAGAALLDHIGPAILITHSQSGAMGWQIADARPELVRAILAIEPSMAPTTPSSGSSPSAYGITVNPLTFEPPLGPHDVLSRYEQTVPDAPGVELCWLQAEPARTLPRLAQIPIAIVVAEASPQAHTAHCVARFLVQAGVHAEFIRLEEQGIAGNGHMMMLERNSDDIAAFLADWIEQRAIT